MDLEKYGRRELGVQAEKCECVRKNRGKRAMSVTIRKIELTGLKRNYMKRERLVTYAMEGNINEKRARRRKRFELIDNIKTKGTYDLTKGCAEDRKR